MQDNQLESKNDSLGKNKYLILAAFAAVVLVLIVGFASYLFYFKDKVFFSRPQKERVVLDQLQKSKDSFEVLQDLPEIENASKAFKTGDFVTAKENLDKAVEKYDFSDNQKLSQSANLFRLAAMLENDRDLAITGYYDFYRDTNNTNLNRAYALMMVSQNIIANNDPQKLLVFLSEKEVLSIKDVNRSEDIYYLINKKIFELYPFPLAAVRIAMYELENVKDSAEAENIFKKYTYNIEANLNSMLKNPGFSHIVPNSFGNLARLQAKMEDFGIVNHASTTALFEKAYTYSKLYSGGSTPHFMLLLLIDYQAKLTKTENVLKLLNNFTTEPLNKLGKMRFKDEQSFEKFYPNLYKLYKEDKELRLALDKITR